MMGFKLQVMDVRKPLVTAACIMEVGHILQFGPRAATGSRVMMEKRRNSFVVKGELESGFPFL